MTARGMAIALEAMAWAPGARLIAGRINLRPFAVANLAQISGVHEGALRSTKCPVWRAPDAPFDARIALGRRRCSALRVLGCLSARSRRPRGMIESPCVPDRRSIVATGEAFWPGYCGQGADA